MVQYKIQCLSGEGRGKTITAAAGENLLAVLREHQVLTEAPCSGKGICGTCRVQVIVPAVPVTSEDRRFFTEQELAAGYRLACGIRVQDHVTVRVPDSLGEIVSLGLESPDKQSEMALLGQESQPEGISLDLESPDKAGKMQQRETAAGLYDLAVDLGSTTLAAALLALDGTVIAQVSAANSQRAYGADVLSRIQASNEGYQKQLQTCICRDLEQLFRKLAVKQGGPFQVRRIAVAGNTVMLHLLRGYSCKTLGQAPFQPVRLELECLRAKELFTEAPQVSDSMVYLLPGISAFVGADITAGLYSSGFRQLPSGQAAFFVDLGTNGELVFGSRDTLFTTSTAAGPAFEGGRLSCGVPGIPGAISKVSYYCRRVRIQTIGQKKPCGICGSGALEAVAALLKEGLMDADGLLAPQLFETGMELARREDGSRICLTQADIREIQMAKAAIRAGLEVLKKRYEEQYGPAAVHRVYLAGGFGNYLSADTAIAVGLFPPEWKERIVPAGNTSLKGAALFLTDPCCGEGMEEIRGRAQGVRLESDPDFYDLYVEQMRFPVGVS